MTRFDSMTQEEARTEYRKLAREYHPDFGGDLKKMQALNAEYAEYSASSAKTEARSRQADAHKAGKKSAADYHDIDELGEILRAKVEALLNISPDLIVEVCGLWVWVTGDTKTHREAIKAIGGMRWAQEKLAWYFPGVPSFNRTRRSLDEIRNMHGSQVYNRTEQEPVRQLS